MPGMMEPQAQQRGISMTFPQSDVPYFVNADQTRVKQVLINLLSNAIKYNREQGTVEVSCAVSGPEARSHQRQGYRRGAGSGKTDAALSAVQPSRTGEQRRGRHRHRPGDEQAGGRADERRDRCGKHGRRGKRVLVRAAPDFRTAPRPRPRRIRRSSVAGREPTGGPLRTLLYVEDNPANLALVEQLIARRSDLLSLDCGERDARGRAGARRSAGRDSDGHQSAWDQRYRSLEDPPRRPDHGTHPHRCPQCQCDAARHHRKAWRQDSSAISPSRSSSTSSWRRSTWRWNVAGKT